MRYRRAPILLWARRSRCPAHLAWARTYSAQPPDGLAPPGSPAPPGGRGTGAAVKERAVAALQHASELGRQWGQRSAKMAAATMNYWWAQYEEFVGLNEVRDAQAKVTEAEGEFMVARGVVREAHASLEALQQRLKEVRDRLDRVSREEAHYLELATQEHRLLQEERRLRTAYEGAEGAEREKFALFSAGVRESHEKERTRAERTKNWSVIGSVLGALIGVMGSTYINRVRLQELRTLLLEAQKGPESLQEALQVQAGNHRSQQAELQALIDGLRVALGDALAQRDAAAAPPSQQDGRSPPAPPPLAALTELQAGGRRAEALLEALPPQLERLESGVGRVEEELLGVRKLLEAEAPPTQLVAPPSEGADVAAAARWDVEALRQRVEETQRTLGERIRTNTLYNAAFTYTATAITVTAVYLLLRGAA